MTNFENIKNKMTIDDVSKYMRSYIRCWCCPAKKFCDSIVEKTTCLDVLCMWLKQEEVDELNMPKVIHAKWIDINGADIVPHEDGQITGEAFCSHCNCYLGGSSEYTVNGKYCPSCGAIMDLGV